MLGLPPPIRACLFDLDGVLTRTAEVHLAAWRKTFDAFLRSVRGDDARPFSDEDYRRFVDGRPRLDGVRSFLASRGLELPEGTTGDAPGTGTVAGLAAGKNERFLRLLEGRGTHTFDGSVRYVQAVRAAGLAVGVVTASSNGATVLRTTGLDALVDARVDGIVARRERLAGKPAPDTFLHAARTLGVAPPAAAVFEDARAGVAAGRAGGFGYVVGVDRGGQAPALRDAGADVVVADLAELLERP